MKFSSAFSIFCVMISVDATYAAPYLPDTPGQVIEYIGEIKFGDETQPVSMTINVLKPIIHPDTSEKVNVGISDYNAVYISGKGMAKVFMMEIPMAEYRWVHKEMGTIKSISKQTIANIEATTTLTLKTDEKK